MEEHPALYDKSLTPGPHREDVGDEMVGGEGSNPSTAHHDAAGQAEATCEVKLCRVIEAAINNNNINKLH